MAERLTMKNPIHPGTFVRLMVLEPLGLNVTDAAKVLGVTRPALSNLLNARASLSPEMAIRLDKAFGADMETLMRMQSHYDIAQAKRRVGEITVAPYQGKAA
jgi:addiction module HigA family antidote